MTAPGHRPDSGPPATTGGASASPLDPSPGRADRATAQPEDAPVSEPPLKPHGDALLTSTGSRQGLDPDPAQDAAPHE